MTICTRHTATGKGGGGPKGAGPERAGLHQRQDTDVTRRLNELFADPALAREQLRTAAELDTVGTDWGDENW